CGSTTVSLSRLKIVDFSSLVFAESTGVMVTARAGINRFDGLAGKTIGVVPGTTNERAVRSQLVQRKLEATIMEFRDREEGVAAVASGTVDGFATDKSVLLSLAQATNAQNLTLLPDDLSFEPFAIMLPRGDPDFRLAINSGLARVFRSGEIIEIYSKYFRGVSPHLWLGAVFTFGALPEQGPRRGIAPRQGFRPHSTRMGLRSSGGRDDTRSFRRPIQRPSTRRPPAGQPSR